MESVIFYSFLSGILIYLMTALLIGKTKANRLVGGAAAAGIVLSLSMSVPFYIGLVASLTGHYLALFIAKRM